MGQPHKHAEVIKAWADGVEVEFRAISEQSWTKLEAPFFYLDFEYRIKPEPPAKVYPVTGMSHDQMIQLFTEAPDGIVNIVQFIANAALRHAIDSGCVVLPDYDSMMESGEAYEKGRNDVYDEAKKQRSARDMAIAERMKQAAWHFAVVAKPGKAADDIYQFLIPSAIIATVKD